MRSILVWLAVAAAVCAQPVPAPPPRGLPAGAAVGDPTAPVPGGIAPDTVVVTIGGRKFTAGELQKLAAALPSNAQQSFNADKKAFVRQYALLRHLAAMAEKAKLDQESPNKERLEYARIQVMVQAQIDKVTAGIHVPLEEQQRLYEQNRDRYRSATVKGIYLPFAAPGAGTPGEEEALAKANQIVKEARAGADFVKLVKEHSQDAESRSKDGDFGTVTPAMRLPEAIKLAIFNLKAGEVGEPVRQNNGFYVFKAVAAGQRSLEEVRAEITREITQAKFQRWFDFERQSVDVRFDNEAYFAAPPPAPPPVPPAVK